MFERFKAWYFPSRPFECGRLYPSLGIRLFKKYLPTSGDLVSRRRRLKRIDIVGAGGRQAAIERFEQQARRWEFNHLVSAALLQAWAVIGGVLVSPIQFWACTAINLVVNVYPVMLQRYNRARIARAFPMRTRPDNSSEPTPLHGAT